MATLNTNEKQILEKLFQMGDGYVLNLSDRTIGEFFQDDIGINIFRSQIQLCQRIEGEPASVGART